MRQRINLTMILRFAYKNKGLNATLTACRRLPLITLISTVANDLVLNIADAPSVFVSCGPWSFAVALLIIDYVDYKSRKC
jgi:hypothetical protein